MNFRELSQLIATRRSVFPQVYNDTPISRETIEQILENANWAPNHRKTEPWRWRVIRGVGREKLSNYLGTYYTDHTPADKYSEIKYKKTIAKPLQSQAIIAICMHRDPAESVPEWEEIAAVSAAVQNMWLSCTALGIGSYWSSPASAADAHDFLELAENELCLGWFYMGYYDPIPLKGQRKPAAEKVTWIED